MVESNESRPARKPGEAPPPQGGGDLPEPCPRWASREERDAWLGAMTLAQQIRRAELDPPEHDYTEDEAALAERRRARGEDRCGLGDPFSYAAERRGPWPRVDSIGASELANTWVADESGGWTPAGFPVEGHRRVSHRELIEQRMPRRCRKVEKRAEWFAETVAEEERHLRAALRLVLAERHGRLRAEEVNATRLAMAWNHMAAGRAALAALRALEKETRRDLERSRPPQLSLFP